MSFRKKILDRKRSGSALLIAILVMSILLLLTLGLSELVLKEIRQTRDVVSSGKAYFAAEAGMENALLDLDQNLPGYELTDYKEFQSTTEKDFHYRYKILNSADKVPYFDPGKALFLGPNEPAITSEAVYDIRPEATYKVLGLNDVDYIPLSSSQYGDVKDFLIQYYFEPDPEHDNFTSGIDLNNPDNFNNIDILNWKIIGHPKIGDTVDTNRTDAISDLYPALYGNGPKDPVCIGTDPSLRSLIPNTNCKYPAPKSSFQPNNPTNVEDSTWGSARTCLSSDAGTQSSTSLAEVQTGLQCSIQNFIQSHSQNYLVLSNVVPADLVGLTNLDLYTGKANIYYRIIAKPGEGEPKLVRESASISADGFAADGKVQQSIDANIGLEQFLPVFNFSLYHTDVGGQ